MTDLGLKPRRWRVVGWIGGVIFALVAVLFVLWLTWVDFVVGSGNDMWPGTGADAWLVVNRRAKIDRGDQVLVKTKAGWSVRRVVALPGEKIAIVDNRPIVPGHEARHEEVRRVKVTTDKRTYRIVRETIDGKSWEIFDDTYREIKPRPEAEVGDGYFVLADNREHGEDSRRWGAIPRDRIRGIVWFQITSGDRPWSPVATPR